MDYLFKILIIGESGVGKTALLVRFMEHTFTQDYITTIGVDYRVKTVKVQQENKSTLVKLQCWDTAGQEKFAQIVNSYYHGSHGIMFMFDLTNQESFDYVQKWMDSAAQHVGGNVVRILIGGKLDLESQRVVTKETAENFAIANRMKYIETSAKTFVNVQEAFEDLAQQILSQFQSDQTENKPVLKIEPQQNLDEKKQKCC